MGLGKDISEGKDAHKNEIAEGKGMEG